MELISRSKTEYLLDAGLETLHADSREWLSQINFWSDDMACFYKLLLKSMPPVAFPTAEMADIEREMIRIDSEELPRVKTLVENHERALLSVIKSDSMTEEDEYRRRHRALVSEVYSLQLIIRDFKKAIFALVKES